MQSKSIIIFHQIITHLLVSPKTNLKLKSIAIVCVYSIRFFFHTIPSANDEFNSNSSSLYCVRVSTT